jgi:NarL family two-component system response regulator LiaR
MPINIIIIEDDALYNQTLRKIIDHEDGMTCVAQCYSYEDAVDQLKALNPHVALVDIRLENKSGIEVMEAVAGFGLQTQYIICSLSEDDRNIVSALRRGASGYLVKGESMEKIVASIREVYRGGVPFSSKVARKVLKQFSPKETFHELTKTEQEVILLVSQGLTYQEIAKKQYVSLDTVRKHLANIYRKLGVNNKVEAINKIRGIM